ncbi:hypothetical protein GQ54DRAFT_296816 [Martensiomyces pterosporus]|nr:hypothetical protein GQ54DRAFT_296816 [Martensiomyces pterosporus]
MQSPIQALPLTIIESIASYVATHNPPQVMAPPNHPPPPTPMPSLVPLRSVSRAWKYVADSQFYQSTYLSFMGSDCYHNQESEILRLDTAIEHGCQRHVKRVHLAFALCNVCLNGDTTIKLRDMLAANGQLTSVYELAILPYWEFSPYMPAQFFEDPKYDTTTGRLVSGVETSKTESARANIAEFVLAIRELMPNIRVMTMHHALSVQHYAQLHREVRTATGLLQSIINNPTRLSLESIHVNKEMLLRINSPVLQSISISRHKHTQCHVELIRRNAPTLVNLNISYASSLAVTRLFKGNRQGSSTLVYPRLEKLSISMCSGYRKPDGFAHKVNPVPVLTSFTCKGHFPFPSSDIIDYSRSRLQVFKIELDNDLFDIFTKNRTLEAGSFKSLGAVSLGWTDRDKRNAGERMCKLFLTMFEIGPHAQVIEPRDLNRLAYDDDVLPKLGFVSSVRVLDLQKTFTTLNETVSLLSKFPNLFKANVALIEQRGSYSLRMPADSYIRECQETMRVNKSAIHALGIHSVGFTRSRRCGEFVVLLADMFPSIRRVRIGYKDKSIAAKVMTGIEFALLRPIYKENEHVQAIDFGVSKHW